MKRLAAFVATLAVAIQPAFANWEWSSWGMTPDQVIAASSGKMQPVEPKPEQSVMGLEHRVSGPWTAYGMDFTADFYFDPASGLGIVDLDLKDAAHCADLRTAAAAAFGPPQETGKVFDHWTNQADDVRIADAALIEKCKLSFSKKP